MNLTKSITIAVITASSLMVASPVMSHADHSASVIKERKQGFKKMGKSMRAMGKQLKSGTNDMAVIEKSVNTIKVQSMKLESWFKQETSTESGYKTDALPAIWSNKPDFAKKAKALRDAATDVQNSLGNSDFELKAAMMQLKKTCGSCHDKYKAD